MEGGNLPFLSCVLNVEFNFLMAQFLKKKMLSGFPAQKSWALLKGYFIAPQNALYKTDTLYTHGEMIDTFIQQVVLEPRVSPEHT